MNLDTTLQFNARRLSAREARRVTASALALGATAILLHKYTRETVLALALPEWPSAAPASVQVEFSEDVTVDTMIAQIEAALRAMPSPSKTAHLKVTWSEPAADATSGLGLREEHRHLSLTIDLEAMAVAVEESSQRGLGATLDLRRLARHFSIAARTIRSRRTRIADVSLLDTEELRQVAQHWSGEECSELAEPGLLHELFETHARERPDQVAVIDGTTRYSYAELNEEAEELARSLRERDIGPGSFVAFQIPRSIHVYVAMLGILKTGAAYVPLDPDYPVERVVHILSDCNASALLTAGPASDVSRSAPCPVLAIDLPRGRRAAGPSVCKRARPPTPADLCYVIYTSGSTGAPKGVAVEHRSARHLVLAEQRLFHVDRTDRVFQGFSIAFDAAVEEIWLAFAAGATLVVGTRDIMLSGLDRFLTEAGVTIFSTVPTLLSTLGGDIPTVRLLIVGGEACPQELAKRWAAAGRRMFNTYGPTEATVIATFAELRADESVTIGRPIPNYKTYIIEPNGYPVPIGVAGELCIGGVGLAREYLANSKLTAASFVPDPFAGQRGSSPRMYKTGDRARFTETGQIEFLGRLDDQIKLRGFRIELGEIESQLAACGGVAQAAAVVREDTPGLRQLVAYVAAREGHELCEETLKRQLRARLPAQMVPARVSILARLPTLTSGKTDKRSLPPPTVKAAEARALPVRDPLEEKIRRSWAELFGIPAVGSGDQFFDDLGGHSLLAAEMVSRLRTDPELSSLSVMDVYRFATPALLSAELRRAAETRVAVSEPRRPHVETPARTFVACATAQASALYVLIGVHAAQWLGPYLAYALLRQREVSLVVALIGAAVSMIFAGPLMLLASIAVKWIVIGRYRAGRYPVWGSYYLRWWIVDRLLAIAPVGAITGTPLMNVYCRLMGARIGENALLGTESIGAFDLVSIGDDATLDAEVKLSGCTVADGELIIGPVAIGRRCVVGRRSVIAGHSSMQDDASIAELSLVPCGVRIPSGQHWAGSPAAPTSRADRSPTLERPSAFTRARYGLAYVLCVLVLPTYSLLAMLPALLVLNRLAGHPLATLLACPALALGFVVVLCLEIALTKWLLLGRVTRGRHEVFSWFYLRKWYFDRALCLSLDVLGGLYATLYLNPWFRLLGVRLGTNAEVSTAQGVVPDLLDIGAGAFVADCASMSAARVGRGWLELDPIRVGDRAFIGNSAVITSGARIGDDCLIGCLSTSPSVARATAKGAAWFGSPPILLPQRQASAPFPVETTYRPSRSLVAQRAGIELARVVLPTAGFMAQSCLLVAALSKLHEMMRTPALLGVFPALYAACGLSSALLVILLKWTLIGRYRAGERPLWSHFVWRTELVSAMQENLVDPFATVLLRGTPFLAWFFRALGTKIGRRVYLGTTHLTEYDLVTIGDDACLNDDCTIQTHLFEDRVMKMAPISIGDSATIGSESVVLYGAKMRRGSSLGPLSLLMKGESLPPSSRWEGIPAAAAGARLLPGTLPSHASREQTRDAR